MVKATNFLVGPMPAPGKKNFYEARVRHVKTVGGHKLYITKENSKGNEHTIIIFFDEAGAADLIAKLNPNKNI